MYNSLRYTKTLEATGFTRDQAEATINLVIETMDYHFATKNDLQGMETNIRSDMKDMETSLRSEMKDIRAEMKEMESRMTLKLGGIMLSGIALMEFLRST